MKRNGLTIWLLILCSYPATTWQIGATQALSNSGSSVKQWEKNNSLQDSPQSRQIILKAKTVFVFSEPLVLYPGSKAVETLKSALAKWGRFHVVDDPGVADLIIVTSEYSSSKVTRMQRISEQVAIFQGGSTANIEATPLWAVTEVGPALGTRPTGKLVEDLRKYLTQLEMPAHASEIKSTSLNGNN